MVVKTKPKSKPSVDLVIPVYNEQGVVGEFHARLLRAIAGQPYQFHFIYINDGSTDQTQAELERIAGKDKHVQVIELSRNFGHQSALTAGLDASTADYLISLDGDGQHPPELIPQMLKLAAEGFDIVLTQRAEQKELPFFKKITSKIFYWAVNKIGDTYILPGGADFRLLSKPAVISLQKMGEYHRFLRGMVAWAGYRSRVLEYSPQERLAGVSKYSGKKMVNMAMNAIFSFSLVPLYVSLSIGVLFFILALAEAIYVISFWVVGRQAQLTPGWASLMFMILILGGSVLSSLGIIGIYIGYIFQEVKHRPVYLIRKIVQRSK